MLVSTPRRSSARALSHAPRNSLPGRRVLCSAPKERTVSAAIPLGVGVATVCNMAVPPDEKRCLRLRCLALFSTVSRALRRRNGVSRGLPMTTSAS